jgi:Icc-related predicted phosphoesterase
MKICAFSDMHGQLNFTINPCDLVLIAGDIVPLRIQTRMEYSSDWIQDMFVPWCRSLPCDKIIFIAGNHDFLFDKYPETILRSLEKQNKIIYLDCGYYEYQGFTIFGTPWCYKFGNWAFMDTEENLEKFYNSFINKIDILLSHDAPYGYSDILLQKDCSWADGKHIGCIALKHFIERINPKYNFHGHLHSTNHKVETLNNTQVYNVSLLDEDYHMVYKPLYLEI